MMIKYKIRITTKFKKQYKLAKKQRHDFDTLEKVISILASGEKLPAKYRDHPLKGEYINCRECHIEPNWLLVYEIVEDVLILYLTELGSHSDLFE